MKPQFSLQTYTIRKYLKNRKSTDEALSKVKSLGLNVLEVSRIKFTLENAKYLKAQCEKLEMTIGSTQIKFDTIKKKFDSIVKIHKMWGCQYIAVSVIPKRFFLRKEKGFLAFAIELNTLGERLKKHNLKLLFHHHHIEFLKFQGKLGLDILMENSKPENVGLVVDTYWTQRGGLNPPDLIEKYRGRVRVVHIRDMKLKVKGFDLLPVDAEVGNGNIDFIKVIKACENSNVAYMALEQKANKPFKSIASSIYYLKNLGLENYF